MKLPAVLQKVREIMTANLRVVFDQNEATVKERSKVLALVPFQEASKCGKTNLEFSTRLAATVMAVHVLSIAWILSNQSEQVSVPQIQAPMMVSLLQQPVPEVGEVIEATQQKSLIEQQPQQKPKVQKTVMQESRPVMPVPAKEVVSQEPVVKEQLQADVAEVSKAVETQAVAKNTEQAQEAVTKKADPAPELESQLEPPRFGAAYLNNPAPEYPALARRKGEQGRVLLKVLVSETGLAEKVQVDTSSGYGNLDQAAVEAVKKWSFIPAKRSNQPVSAYVLVPVKFSLNS